MTVEASECGKFKVELQKVANKDISDRHQNQFNRRDISIVNAILIYTTLHKQSRLHVYIMIMTVNKL